MQRMELYATRDEYEQVKLAARLRHLSVPEYIRRALNAQMRSEGVDAVLFEERDDKRSNGLWPAKLRGDEDTPRRSRRLGL